MPALHSLAMAVQTTVDVSAHDIHLLMIFVFFIMIALAVQAIGICVAAGFGAKLLHKLESVSDSFDQKTTPILAKTSTLIDDVAPKIRSVTENIEQVSYTIRAKSDELADTVTQLNRTVQEVNLRTRAQAAKVDGMVSEALDATQDIQRTVQDSIRGPVRQIAGIVAGVRAGVETLVARSPFGKRGAAVEDPYDL